MNVNQVRVDKVMIDVDRHAAIMKLAEKAADQHVQGDGPRVELIAAVFEPPITELHEKIVELQQVMSCGHPRACLIEQLHRVMVNLPDEPARSEPVFRCAVCEQLTELVTALENLANACVKADEIEELSGEIDGSLIDKARAALARFGKVGT
jgi:hypothetical protein